MPENQHSQLSEVSPLVQIQYESQYPDPMLFPEFQPGIFKSETAIYANPGRMQFSRNLPLVTWGAKSCEVLLYGGEHGFGIYHRIPFIHRVVNGNTELPTKEKVQTELGTNICLISLYGQESHPVDDQELEFVEELDIRNIRKLSVVSGFSSDFAVAYRPLENLIYVNTYVRDKPPGKRYITTYKGF